MEAGLGPVAAGVSPWGSRRGAAGVWGAARCLADPAVDVWKAVGRSGPPTCTLCLALDVLNPREPGRGPRSRRQDSVCFCLVSRDCAVGPGPPRLCTRHRSPRGRAPLLPALRGGKAVGLCGEAGVYRDEGSPFKN